MATANHRDTPRHVLNEMERRPDVYALLNELKAALSAAEWEALGDELRVDFDKIDREQWVIGCRHEMEHWETVGHDPLTVAKIARDHLREDRDYYKKLKE